MSRQHQRHHQTQQQQQLQQQQQQQQQQLTVQQQQQQQLLMAEHAAAAEAAELFDLLCVATTMRQILALHRTMCEAVGLRPSPLNDYYPKLKAKVRSWKAAALWKKFDARAAHRVYGKGTACAGTRVLVIGAGPCGLRTAIEAQLLGAKVVVLEKRDRISRNNVLHLWPFVITDLRNLGAKKFYGKFCAGSIDHISIRQLQCMLLKVALLLGVEIHEGVSFEHALEPGGDAVGWRAAVTPADHPVSHYEFDVLIGADGKRNMLDFRRKEFRGKLAIAITANFVNKKTEAEAKVEEISGVAFIFNQAFFKELYGKTGIDLENIVYYKDETHYFVMTAKKHSLIDKGVIIEDMADPAELLAGPNVDTQKLHDYAREAAEFSTQYQMPNLEFAVNHYGKPDVAMFDFTSMFAAEMSCRVIVRKGCRLLQCLVGDSLLEPFWPTGSGCARGFLSSMDAAYAIKLWSNPQNSTLGVLAQRESIYRLLNQTTPDTLQRDISAYTVDPATRYPNLNRESVNSWQVKHLIDTDDPSVLEQTFMDTQHAGPHVETPGRRKRRSGDSMPQGASLLRWIAAQLHSHQFVPELKEPSDVLRNGRVLCGLISRYRPDLIEFAVTKDMSPLECNELAFAVLERELGVKRIMSAKQSLELTDIESRIWLNYLDQICELFRGEIPHIKHPKMDFSDLRQKHRINHTHAPPDFSKLLQMKPKAKSPMQDAVDVPTTVQRRSVLEEERAKRQRRHEQLLNSGGAGTGTAGAAGGGSGVGGATAGGGNLHHVGQNDTPRRSKKRRQTSDKTANISSKVALAFKKQAASEKCRFCKQTVYLMEKTTVEGLVLHRNCLKCHHCHTNLRLGGYAFDRDDPQGRFYCTQHFRLPSKPLPQRSNKARKSAAAAAVQAAASPAARAAATVERMDTNQEEADQAAARDQVDLLETTIPADALSDDEANVIDEHEWSGRNFLPESNNDSQSELSSSDESDTESDSEIFEEADDSPFGAQTLQLASDWIGKQYCGESDDTTDSYDSSDGIADDGKDDTEGEDFKKARELRREEVRLQPLPANLPTDTETEVQTESESTSPDEIELNSATEISTDSEFDNDEITRQTAPKIFIDDTHLRKPTKVQIKSTMITPNAAAAGVASTGLHEKQLAAREKGGSYLKKYQPQPPLPQFKPLVQVDPTLLIGSQRAAATPLQNPRPGDYLLNKTASTEGIASKKSLELKKRYLLGEPANGNKIQKSGSTSVLDSRIRSFQSNISECQKLLNPSSDISAGMKSFLDRTKLGEGQSNDLMRSATSNVINDLRVELKIQKAPSPSSNSTDNEKENVFVNCKNELNKGMEYTDAVNATLLDQLNRKSSPTTPTNNQNNKTVIEVIDLVTPEKKPLEIIDLTLETPKKPKIEGPDSNKLSEKQLQQEEKQEQKLEEDVAKPDVSKDVKECIPDILGDIKAGVKQGTKATGTEEQQSLLSDEEKRDSPEKEEHDEQDTVQIQVPNIPWTKPKLEPMSTTGSSGGTSCSSSSNTSSIEDIQHYILESTTSPDTQTAGGGGGKHNVPRLEVHDTSGALMQVDSLMIVNGKYIGDPEDVKYLDMPADVIVPPAAALRTNELEEPEDDHDVDVEPVTATPEPAECTVIEAERLSTVKAPPPLPEMGPPKLRFDSKNENKIESLKNLPLIVERTAEHSQAVKPITLNLSSAAARTPDTPTTPTAHDSDKTPTGEMLSRGSDSETEHTGTGTGTGQVLTETELSDWTADDCISENFVDMEFVLNSNKGTMKRRKERRRGGAASRLPSGSQVIHELARQAQAPVVEMEGILSAIDIDDIEFMDTGSEGSCAEAYSATNTALLQNRGYMEYIETEPKRVPLKPSQAQPPLPGTGFVALPALVTKRDEKLGIDYIEQGAYIMHDDAKTPVNEQLPAAMTQSLTDSSTLNDLDDDSMAGQTLPTTTEESEALTVVTSPLDTSSPRMLDQFASMLASGKADSTPSSSEQQPKTSTVTTSSSSAANSSTPGGHESKEAAAAAAAPTDEDLQIQFEYVRALQHRISQISTQRRKSSKGEAANTTVIDSAEAQLQAQPHQPPGSPETSAMRPRSSSSSSKVPEIPTLSSKLEEITKERTKQKDLIHDLVMDKLQSKKQLNAEKRLHRSRQRSLLTSGYASGASLSPTPKLAAAASPQDSNCSSQAHYHASSATAEEKPSIAAIVPPPVPSNPLQKSATASYVSPYRTVQPPTRSADLFKPPRPFSEHIDANALEAGYKLNKTASFNSGSGRGLGDFVTPIAPARSNRGGGGVGAGVGVVASVDVMNISVSTENLRSEARARARLKSNSDLGLSPEEKLQLLRKRLHYDHPRPLKPKQQLEEPLSVDLAARARKMSASKSVNDLAYMVNSQQQQVGHSGLDKDAAAQAKAADFTSDPNLAASSGVQEKAMKTKTGRQKDPERRKSLIQSLSSFFQKGSHSHSASASASASASTSPKEQGVPVAASHSEQSERPGTSSSGTPTISDGGGNSGGGGGVFSRFRISPKSKEKSKSCFDLRNFGFGDKDVLIGHSTSSTNAATAAAATATRSQTNHSQDYLNTTTTTATTTTATNNSRYRKQTNTAKPKIETFSSSSPQLYIHKPHHHLAAANALDDQTPPPIPPLPLNYQRSDDESYANETREHKKQRAISKASRQAELKRLRIAQEIQREQEEIEVQLKDLEGRGVLIEKALRGEAQNFENLDTSKDNDEKLLKELLEIWRNITALKKRDEELTIRQQELQLEYRHAQLKEELNLRLSCNKLDKSSADVAAEGAILNEMLEIVAKRAALRPTASQLDLTAAGTASTSTEAAGIKLTGQPHDHEESNI
ncbi:F-actin-monooxygenase Mical isoform X8 [Drosophila pseudoobscura]|uniref:F-actin monooxygenase n=1 Tax=Drosophila pseudoobscura pseudoobscura TaxID=46245 RepID=A0A6I8VQ58_DROPS|nr:F-actin-monooxygenase Mical isoform X8 [Drosophila pseudoobscura]